MYVVAYFFKWTCHRRTYLIVGLATLVSLNVDYIDIGSFRARHKVRSSDNSKYNRYREGEREELYDWQMNIVIPGLSSGMALEKVYILIGVECVYFLSGHKFDCIEPINLSLEPGIW